MTHPIKNRLIGTVLLLGSLQFGFAQSQSNTLTFAFGPPLTPVWDISGTYQITNRLEGDAFLPKKVIFRDLLLSVDAKGKVQGAGTIRTWVDEDWTAGDYRASGKVSGGGEKTQVQFTIKYKGQGVVEGVSTTCKASVIYQLTIQPGELAMAGKENGKAQVSNLFGGEISSSITLPLPPGADGGWNVQLELANAQKKLSGAAVVSVNSTPTNATTTLATKVSGNAPSQPGRLEMKLSGYGYSSGTKLNLEVTPTVEWTNLTGRVDGKVLGQNVKN
jgi:hypothetical protein